MTLLDAPISLIIFTALLLSLTTLTQFFATYASAYASAPRELATFTSYLESSIQENESYDIDISSLAASTSLKDKMRLSLLLQEIQKCGDDMREELNRLLINDLTSSASGGVSDIGDVKLKPSARLSWALKKKELEDRVKRIDMLRLRFLVVYMSVVASSTRAHRLPTPPFTPEKQTANSTGWTGRTPDSKPLRSSSLSSTDSSETVSSTGIAHRPGLPHALTDGIIAAKKEGGGRPTVRPLRRLNTQAMGHNDNSGGGQRMGWLGVVQELQRSPVMRARHASIEGSDGGRPSIDGVFAGLP